VIRALAATAAVAATALIGAPPAAAEYKTTTAQALAAHAEWLPYAPPPPNGAAAVCLVDTGVDLNPDTASNVIARIALDGGDPSDLSDSKHGTQMAMVMGAPINDWGMVGFWPGVRIVSVRATSPGEQEFTFAGYSNGIRACQEERALYPIVAIVLALGGRPPATPQEADSFADRVSRAQAEDMSVVVAAGNTDGAPEGPAADPSVLTVGATSAREEPCPGTARGGTIDLQAPGCGLDEADPRGGAPLALGSGTSQAAVEVSVALASIRTWAPSLSAAQTEALIADGSHQLATDQAFGAAGLTDVVLRARTVLNSESGRVVRKRQPPRSGRPRFHQVRRGNVVVISFLNANGHRRVRVVDGRRGSRRMRLKRRLTLRIAQGRRYCIRYEDPVGGQSRPTCVRAP
jgi:hypothetical protein